MVGTYSQIEDENVSGRVKSSEVRNHQNHQHISVHGTDAQHVVEADCCYLNIENLILSFGMWPISIPFNIVFQSPNELAT